MLRPYVRDLLVRCLSTTNGEMTDETNMDVEITVADVMTVETNRDGEFTTSHATSHEMNVQAADVTTTDAKTPEDVLNANVLNESSSTITSTPVAICPFFNMTQATVLPIVPELLPIAEDDLWIMTHKLLEDILGSSSSSAVEALQLTDIARKLLKISNKIHRKWRVGPFHSIRELCEKLELPIDANRNRLIGALFSHIQPPSVRVKAVRNTAKQYEVATFTPWLRTICAILDILAVHNVQLYNTISNAVVSK
jgi:hypothetical protein